MRIKKGEIILKEQILNEDFNSQQELERLTVDIFKAYIADIVEEKRFVVSNQRFPKLWLFTSFKNKDKYNTLADFMENFRLMFTFKSDMSRNATFEWRGLKNGFIEVNYNIDEIVKVLNDLDPTDSIEEQVKDMYYAIYNNHTLSAILHELQHAYDYYRSGGKLGTDRKSKELNKVVGNGIPKGEDYNKYLKLQHEVEARFTQAINLTNSLDSIQSYIKEFEINFKGWDRMTPKIKKHLIRRASQYYHKKTGKM